MRGAYLHILGSHVDARQVHGEQPVAGSLALVQRRANRLGALEGHLGDAVHEGSKVRAALGSLQGHAPVNPEHCCGVIL